MSEQPEKKKKRERNFRFTLQVEVESGDESRLETIKRRLQEAKVRMGLTKKTAKFSNARLIENLLELYDSFGEESVSSKPEEESDSLLSPPAVQSKFEIHTAFAHEEDYIVSSTSAIGALFEYMISNKATCNICCCDLLPHTFRLVRKDGHCGVMEVMCESRHNLRWYSSSIKGGKYTVNLR